MAIVKKGTLTVTSGGAAQSLNLGFVPSYFRMTNKTKIVATTNGVVAAEWWSDNANASAYITTTSAGDGTNKITYLSSNGFTPLQTTSANEFTATNLTITGISKAAQAVVTATNSLSVGDVVTFSGVVGMTQINTLRGTVVATGGGTAFTVDIDTSSFTTYSSGGIANIISGTTVNAGVIGLTLGSSLMVTTNDVWEYLAILDTDVTS